MLGALGSPAEAQCVPMLIPPARDMWEFLQELTARNERDQSVAAADNVVMFPGA